MNDPAPRLSVVVAVDRASEAVGETLRRWTAEADDGSEELVVVVADPADEARVRELAPTAQLRRGRRRALVPELWGLGIEAARAPWVALTIGDCVPDDGWRRHLRAVTQGAAAAVAAVGGPILPPVGGGGREWALFLQRYAGYLATANGPAAELPGDNAVYRRDDLERAWRDRAAGFWEATVDAELRRAGRELRFDTGLRVRLVAAPPALRTAGRRFRHGLRFGATRSLSPGRRLVAALAAPLLAPLLLLRVRRRLVAARPEWRSRFGLALPWLLLFVGAWSLGEACGYWTALARRGRR